MKSALSILLSLSALLLALPALAAEPATLPATPYSVRVDGDPREAFLLGAEALPAFDAVTGAPDGSVRAYALAERQGLYVALLSTEPDGDKGLLRPLPWMPSEEAVLGDWMAVRIGPPASARLYLLAPGGYKAVLGPDGRPPASEPKAWEGADSTFGTTWAGEWLLPWTDVGRPGEPFTLEVLRGRKIHGGRYVQESMAHTSPGPASWRWGGDGREAKVPSSFPAAPSAPRALKPYEVRPFVPPGEEAAACEDAAPAGSTATAWLEVPPGPGRVTISLAPEAGRSAGLSDCEVFALDFWWQAGRREEIDARFPVRVAAGLGDVLVGERLIPQPAGGFEAGPWPLRVVVRAKVPADGWTNALKAASGAEKPTLRLNLEVAREGGEPRKVPWTIALAPPLPASSRLAGVYYLERDPSRWARDLRDLSAHGVTAATCPAQDEAGWRRFQEAARAAGVDGAWAMNSAAVPRGETAWAYVCDEPATQEAMAAARARAEAFRSRGLNPWAALAWPNSLHLAGVLDGVAVPPNLVGQVPALPSKRRWVYVQGLREDPFYNRVWAALLSRAPGLDGFWVFCYSTRDGKDDDWAGPIIRHDALVDSDNAGGRTQTVQFEALREGIVDGRLLDALGPRAKAVLERFPGAPEAERGDYWKARGRGWTFADLRRALVQAWAAGS